MHKKATKEGRDYVVDGTGKAHLNLLLMLFNSTAKPDWSTKRRDEAKASIRNAISAALLMRHAHKQCGTLALLTNDDAVQLVYNQAL